MVMSVIAESALQKTQRSPKSASPVLPRPQSSAQNGQGYLQRQSNCACGGSCPSCKASSESSDGAKETVLQKKLSIGASNDPLEQEADRIADQVLSSPMDSSVSHSAPRIQRFTSHAAESSNNTAPASVDNVLAGSGNSLEPAIQNDMSQRFGHDFSDVRVHSGAAAQQSARDVNANAYTVGNNIVFGAGHYIPTTHQGKRLLAHELTHVVQQQGIAAEILRDNNTSSFSKIASPFIARQSQQLLQKEDSSTSLPGFSQGYYDSCGAASVVTALMIWDRERKDKSTPNELLVTACNLILAYMFGHRTSIISGWKAKGQSNAETRYKAIDDSITVVRDSANTPGTTVTAEEYKKIGFALYDLHTSGGGLSQGEIDLLLVKLGLSTEISGTAETFDGLFDTSVIAGLVPERIAQVHWLARVGAVAPDGSVSMVPHTFLVGRFKDGKWFLSDQGMSPPTELMSPDLATLHGSAKALATTGKSWLHTGSKPVMIQPPWTGAKLLGKHEQLEEKSKSVITPGDFLAEVDAGVTTTGDAVIAWDYVVRRNSLDEAKAARYAGAHGFAIIEMPAGVFHLYKTNMVSKDNVNVTGIDRDDSKNGVLMKRKFSHAWLGLCSAEMCSTELISVQ
jgi:Domain of unknown function (DUF4157)